MKGHGMRLVAVVAGVAVMAAAGALELAGQESFEWSGRLADGGTLKVRGISGTIRAQAAPAGAARVTARKQGRSGDFDQVEIRMEQDGEDVVVCAVYGSRMRSEGCEGGGWVESDRGRGRNRSIDVSVDFVVHLPAGTPLDASLVSGDVTVSDVRSDVQASTVSGDIVVSTTGVAHARSVSGSVDVAMGATGWRELDFNTVSGDITLRMPEALDAEVDFSSLSGDFESDFAVTLRGQARRQWVGSRVRGTIGEGGRSLSVKTVSGDLRLLRGR